MASALTMLLGGFALNAISFIPFKGLNYGLKTLNLSWNSIRNKGAVSMAASLKVKEIVLSPFSNGILQAYELRLMQVITEIL